MKTLAALFLAFLIFFAGTTYGQPPSKPHNPTTPTVLDENRTNCGMIILNRTPFTIMVSVYKFGRDGLIWAGYLATRKNYTIKHLSLGQYMLIITDYAYRHKVRMEWLIHSNCSSPVYTGEEWAYGKLVQIK